MAAAHGDGLCINGYEQTEALSSIFQGVQTHGLLRTFAFVISGFLVSVPGVVVFSL